ANNTPKLNCIRSDAEISDRMNLPYKTFSEDCSTSIAGKWIIAPEAGALKVGPEPGSGLWWQVTEATLSERICYFDDIYEFGEDGSFKNILGDETFLSEFQGVSELQCGALVAPHDGSLDASYQYTPETGKLTLIGKGAFLGLAKVVNGSELEDPNAAPETITYNVSFSENGNRMTLVIESDQGVFWTYELIKEAVFIADNNFEQALIDLNIDSDGTINHRILRSDAERVYSLDVSKADNNSSLPNVNNKIQDLTGIEAFTNLTYLTCHSNEISDLDVSASTSLWNLHCPFNRIEKLILPETETLTWLNFSNNNLTEVDISGIPKVVHLSGSWNQLTSIDVNPN
ncbi:hypothetical protein ACFQ29_40490, partial [Longispora fulva]